MIPASGPERSAYFASLSKVRWDKPREHGRRRVRTFEAGSPMEQRWMKRAEDLGLVDEGMSHTGHRRLAKRLADDDTANRVRRIHEPRPATVTEDDDLRRVHLEAEAVRWRTRAERDRKIAAAHDLLADQAEAELTDIMFRNGFTS